MCSCLRMMSISEKGNRSRMCAFSECVISFKNYAHMLPPGIDDSLRILRMDSIVASVCVRCGSR